MGKRRLLIVEDSLSAQAYYRELLSASKMTSFFEIQIAASAEEAVATLQGAPPDIVILDWILPKQSGIAVLDAIRSDPRARSAMVFVVTSRTSSELESEVLQLGADDYLAKPFDEEVLIARLKGLARRVRRAPSLPKRLRFQGLELEVASGTLRVGDQSVSLQPKEAELLSAFLESPDAVLTPEYLWDSVWGYPSPEFKNTLQVALSNMRRKLGVPWARRFKTIRGRGYVLRANRSVRVAP